MMLELCSHCTSIRSQKGKHPPALSPGGGSSGMTGVLIILMCSVLVECGQEMNSVKRLKSTEIGKVVRCIYSEPRNACRRCAMYVDACARGDCTHNVH
jgi:hypothetical protein